jgi:hypothetical protein
MEDAFSSGEWTLRIGDRDLFSIEVILPSLSQHIFPTDSSSVLLVTEGWFTVYVNGQNIFEVEPHPTQPSRASSHCLLSMSMILEWIYFDQSYNLLNRVCRFSDIGAGDSSPPISFKLVHDKVKTEWDFTDSARSGMRYLNMIGCGLISYHSYLMCLAVSAECLISAIEWRSLSVGRFAQWREWLAGYLSERRAFHNYLTSEFKVEFKHGNE